MVMLKVSPWEGVIRFGKRGSRVHGTLGGLQNHRQELDSVGIQVKLPDKLRGIHKHLPCLNLMKSLSDENLLSPLEEIQHDEKICHYRRTSKIMDRNEAAQASRIPMSKEVLRSDTRSSKKRLTSDLIVLTCGVNLLLGTCLNCTYGDGKPVTCCGCEGPLRGGFCSFCASRDGNSFDYNPNPNSFNESQNFSDYPPQPRYETNFCELCGNDTHFGYDCPTQVPFNSNPDPCYNQNFDNNFPLTSPSFPQQYLCCENCGGPHETFQCQPMNQDFYNSNPSGFDQFQPPQFPVNYPPQETNKEILQAREDLMETIQAFLKEYDHIPPNKKCMALLLAEERFLKIKQTMEEEQNQPEVMQELLLKLMNDLQILKGIQQEKKETAAQSFIPYWNFSMIDDEEARENFMKDFCTFLRKFSRIPFGVMPKVLSIAWERFGEIKDALTDEQYQQDWNRPTFYDNDDDEYTIIYSKAKAITPDLPIEEPDNSLIMGDEHLDTIPSVENLVPILSEFEGISEDTCDVPVYEDPSTFDALNDHSEILSNPNDDGTLSDDDDFEDIEYVSLEEVNDVDQEEKEFDLEDILQIQDVILREKLLNINRLIANIESLNDNSTPNCVLKSTSPFPIPDSNSFFEKSDTSLSYSDNSLPEFESFSDHTEETSSGSTTTHANNSLPEYDSFHFEIEPDQGGLTNVVMEEILGEPRVILLMCYPPIPPF
ncbi:hypothetical protein Tco_1018995 [Tanacetum coccineum]|uniref:CCHC-type domain-containing protein n=1 Tax=Tanacetum coccineum TaxID=301880 RepID=A0ABQ5FXC9_9ASTR